MVPSAEEYAYAAAAPRRSSVKETSDARDGVVGSHSVEATVTTDCRAARRRKTRGDGGGAVGDFMVRRFALLETLRKESGKL